EVVDAAVENESDASVIGEHGLISAGAQVDDGEAAVSQQSLGPLGGSFGIGATAAEGVDHRIEGGFCGFAIRKSRESRDAAHTTIVSDCASRVTQIGRCFVMFSSRRFLRQRSVFWRARP